MTKYFKTMREALHEARQFRDPKVDLKVVKNNKVIVIDKSDWPTYKAKGWMQAESTQEKSAPPIPDNVKHLFDKDKNFKDKLSKFKFIKMVKAGQVKGVTPSMVDDITELTEFTSAQMTKLKKE